MTPRAWLLLAVAATSVFVWYFRGRISALLFEPKVIEENVIDDELAKDIPLTGSESKRVAELLPHVQRALQKTLNDLSTQGIKVLVGQTIRTEAQVKANLTKGTSATTKSWHLLRRAVDCYIIDPTTDQPDMAGKNLDLYRKMHQTAAKYGFTNIAFYVDWSKRMITTSKGKIWDGGHMQLTDGLTWDAARAKDDVS